jgi:SEC-C motif
MNPDAGSGFDSAYRLGSPANRDFAFVKPFGYLPAMRPADAEVVVKMLTSHKPENAILGKAIEMIRLFADRPEAQGTIGKQLCSITLSVDRNVPARSDYHSHIPTHTSYVPDYVVLHPSRQFTVSNISIAPADPATTPPSVGPKLGRNQPCFCGSGKKYKLCRGRSHRG